MKATITCLVLNVIFINCFATDYYSQGSVTPVILSNWNTNPQGGGTAPASFINPGDKFIIQAGHSMVTTATWTIGNTGSVLEILNGGSLQGSHRIILAGTFQLDDGGTYIHDNTGSVAETTGNSIFSGNESFASNSNFEIRNWPGKNVGLPNASPGISWGNLVINLQVNLSPDMLPWNWNIADGATLTIKGNLDIKATYITYAYQTELCFALSGMQTIYVAGNFLMSGYKTKVSLKGSCSPGYATMQVNGDVLLKDMVQLNLGLKTTSPDPQGSYELRFKGNFSVIDYAIMVYDSNNGAYLVANGTSPQTFICISNFNRNFRVAPGATVNLGYSLNTTSRDVMFAVSGTFNQNGNTISTYGNIECAGGVFNSTGNLQLAGTCMACSNLNNTYNNTGNTWCTASGKKGRINFTNSVISLNNSLYSNLLSAGSAFINSPGDIYFINSISKSANGASNSADYLLHENSIFSLDENSYIGGSSARYQGKGGMLRIGSVNGISAAGNTTTGNIRTGSGKDYDFSNLNSFEYFGMNPQVTGDGLPAVIDGTLRINNNAGPGTNGVTLSGPTTVSGALELSSGKLTSSTSGLIAIDKNASVYVSGWGNSYVDGPMKKIGSTAFKFPIGKGNNFAPITLSGTGIETDEYIAEYFTANPVMTIGASFDNPPIDHLSRSEWWNVSRSAGTTSKTVTLEATAYSDAILLSDLRIMRWDSTAWRDEGNAGFTGVSAGEVTSNIINSFFDSGAPTPFTFGSVSGAGDPLAIHLISFDAIKITNTKALLNWELGNNSSATAKFEIEKANSNRNFAKIGTVSGSAVSLLYNYTDNDLKNGITYYRLKMTDENGKVTYSRVAAVVNQGSGILLTSLAPTIVTDKTVLTITSPGRQNLDIIITDMEGRIMQKQNHVIVQGNTNIPLSTDRLAAGVYQVYGVVADGKTNVIRFARQ